MTLDRDAELRHALNGAGDAVERLLALRDALASIARESLDSYAFEAAPAQQAARLHGDLERIRQRARLALEADNQTTGRKGTRWAFYNGRLEPGDELTFHDRRYLITKVADEPTDGDSPTWTVPVELTGAE